PRSRAWTRPRWRPGSRCRPGPRRSTRTTATGRPGRWPSVAGGRNARCRSWPRQGRARSSGEYGNGSRGTSVQRKGPHDRGDHQAADDGQPAVADENRDAVAVGEVLHDVADAVAQVEGEGPGPAEQEQLAVPGAGV